MAGHPLPTWPSMFCITANMVWKRTLWDWVSEPVGNGAGSPKVDPFWTAKVNAERYRSLAGGQLQLIFAGATGVTQLPVPSGCWPGWTSNSGVREAMVRASGRPEALGAWGNAVTLRARRVVRMTVVKCISRFCCDFLV